MRIPISWLKEFVPIQSSGNDLAGQLRRVGVPVTRVETLAEGIHGVYSGKIAKLEAHPNADKLKVAEVSLGKETLQIITGAPNVAAGDIIPIAKVGARLAGGKTIEAAQLRGLPSSGMMCSASELSLDLKEYLPQSQRDGVLVLHPETPLGIDLSPMLALNEEVLVLEPFANRPDFLSVFGVAREVAALSGAHLKLPSLDEPGRGDLSDRIRLTVSDTAGCPRYIARYASNVSVAPSPLWMAIRLSAAGIRPINNIVDITNYVLVELGQPLHAFDHAKLSDKTIEVRRARNGESLVGIDEKTYSLSDAMLVIADAKRPVALAGVMGGKGTEISNETREVLLEAATFSPSLVRRASLALGLRTESSRRFEKGLDPLAADWGSRRACHLLRQAGALVSEGVADHHEKTEARSEITINLSDVQKLLGLSDLKESDAKRILTGLGFETRSERPFVIAAPLFRRDIREPVDVAEEVARHYGYDRIPTVLPSGRTTVASMDPIMAFEFQVRSIFRSLGLGEMMTYSLGDPLYYNRFSSALALIQNPLTEDRKALRPFLYPEMLLSIQKNLRVKNHELTLFELGRVFKKNGSIEEKRHAGVALTGKLPSGREVSFFTLKGILEELWSGLHVQVPLEVSPKSDSNFHPRRFASFGAEGKEVGFLGEVHPALLESLDIEERVMILECDLDLLHAIPKRMKVSLIPQYPESRRDVSMIVREDVPAGSIQGAIRKAGGALVEDVRIFDVYHGKQVPEGHKSIALAIIYRSHERTLTDNEVNALHIKILDSIKGPFQATLRT